MSANRYWSPFYITSVVSALTQSPGFSYYYLLQKEATPEWLICLRLLAILCLSWDRNIGLPGCKCWAFCIIAYYLRELDQISRMVSYSGVGGDPWRWVWESMPPLPALEGTKISR